MQELTGKYTSCKIFTDYTEQSAISQVYEFLNHPAFKDKKTRFMPDIHAGSGAVIGTTVELGDKVIPNTIGVDIGCLDKETEYLTESGWKGMSDYKKGDKVLQYDKNTDEASFIEPLNYIDKPCEEFYHLKNSKGLDQMVSEEHKILVWKGYKSKGYTLEDWNPVSLNNLGKSLKKGYYSIKTSFNMKNTPITITDEMLRLEVMVAADGCIKWKREDTHQIYLHFRKQRKIDRAEFLLKENNIKYKKTLGVDGSTHMYFFVDKNVNKKLSKFYKADARQLGIIAEESLLWDGHKGYRSYFSSTDKDNTDLIQFAFSGSDTRAGISVTLGAEENRKDCYAVTPTQNNNIGITDIVKVSRPNSRKYCFTVPTGYFVIRRNGRVSITGNCGMESVKLSIKDINYKALDRNIKQNIPAGFSINNKMQNIPKQLEQDIITTCKEIGIDTHRALFSLGTLGGGNHFIEVGRDEQNFLWLTIHSGSRNFGLQIAKYHQKIAEQNYTNPKPDLTNVPPKEREAYSRKFKESRIKIPKGMEYLTGEDKALYEKHMKVAQRYASESRKIMVNNILRKLDCKVLEEIESIHNYIDFTHGIIRKGAISAQKDELVIIPWNMRDGLIIGRGKGNPDWNFSAPHGAGRTMSRSQAKKEVGIEEFKESMEGIYSSCVSESTLDESPMAYKDHHEVERYLEESVEILHRVRPEYNFKA